jgi:hypothetical protein
MSLTQINEDTTVLDTKYIVFKRDEFKEWQEACLHGEAELPEPLHDATVIRGQDLFAAPALESYANSIGIAMQVMGLGWQRDELSKVADYFFQRAQEARMIGYKLPDNGGER